MIKKWILALAYPPVCPLCEGALPISMEGAVCGNCKGKLPPPLILTCYKCGRPLEEEEYEYCSICKKTNFHFKKGFIVFPYEEEIKKAILHFKYYGRKDLALFFANQTWLRYEADIRRIKADAIIPIPVHKSKLRQRGYNQAEVYAGELSKLSGIPVVGDLLIRTKHTKAQKNLSALGRLTNLLDAFDIDLDMLCWYKKRMALNRVILVDDIFTTGSTIECSTIKLMAVGIEEVYSICISSPKPL